jgi:hypothetical protein
LKAAISLVARFSALPRLAFAKAFSWASGSVSRLMSAGLPSPRRTPKLLTCGSFAVSLPSTSCLASSSGVVALTRKTNEFERSRSDTSGMTAETSSLLSTRCLSASEILRSARMASGLGGVWAVWAATGAAQRRLAASRVPSMPGMRTA